MVLAGPATLYLCGMVLIKLSGADKMPKKPKYITVYIDPRSTCSRAVLFLLKEKVIPRGFRTKIVDLTKKDQKRPEHLRVHPFGKVPVLETDRGVLYETSAILRFI